LRTGPDSRSDAQGADAGLVAHAAISLDLFELVNFAIEHHGCYGADNARLELERAALIVAGK
jgi:hypothetical protein